MDLAVIRITQALAHRETLLVYGDYDVDGVTSTSLLVQFFRQFLDNVYHYIPDREKDGYGVSRDGIDYALEKGAKLIITCDCGITAVDQSNYAAEKGIDMIITDHHEPAEDLPDALAVIDPKQHDDKYPFREL